MFIRRVRSQASQSIVTIQNKIVVQQPLISNQNILLKLFQTYYGCKSAPYIPASNNFVVTSANLQSYHLMQVRQSDLLRYYATTRTYLDQWENYAMATDNVLMMSSNFYLAY